MCGILVTHHYVLKGCVIIGKIGWLIVLFFTRGATVNSCSFPTGNSRLSKTCHVPWLTKAAYRVLSEGQPGSLVKNAMIQSYFCDLNFADT